MAITEWSWQASNGAATAEQTIAAYNALIGKDYTEKFSRLVWNDLCAKVREVALAVKGDWYAYGGVSYSSMLMNSAYGELSSGRFNALRQNTHYPTWKWAYDSTSEGYIGRTDFRGVASYGEFNSDFVYGVYFIELTQRLNQIIRILNGTEPVYELTAAPRAVLTPTPSGIVLPPSSLRTSTQLNLNYNGGIVRLPGAELLNQFIINGPVIRAVAETGQFSNYEARIYMTLSYTRNLRQLPSASLQSVPVMTLTPHLLGELIPTVNGTAALLSALTGYSHMEKLPTVNIFAGGTGNLTSAAALSKDPSLPIDPLYAYSVLRPYGWIDSKKPCDLSATFRSWGTLTGNLAQSEPSHMGANGRQNLTAGALLQQTDEFRSLRASWTSGIESEAALGILENGLPMSASGISRVIFSAVPTIRRYAYAKVRISAVVSYYALLQIDTTWEYPIHIGDDLSFTQVWQTEENDEHLFWDFDRFYNRTGMTASTAAIPAQILPAPFTITAGCSLSCVPTARTYRTSDWEYPVQTGTDLYIPQSEQNHTKKHRLEVK